MSRTTRFFVIVLSFAIAASTGFALGVTPEPAPGVTPEPAPGVTPFPDGHWEGTVDLPPFAASADASEADAPAPPDTVGAGGGADAQAASTSEPFALTLFPADPEAGTAQGGLVDMSSRGLFGFPLGEVVRDSEGISFTLRGKAPFDGLFELKLAGGAKEGGEGRLEGKIRLLSPEGAEGRTVLAEGDFSLAPADASARLLEYGIDCLVDSGRGILPGSLFVPEFDSGKAPPLVLLLSGAHADRDGNNYEVPGKSDSLLQLALSLRGRGVASLRFDKRGTGEAYALVDDESTLRFDDYIDDARAALRSLAADLRFSSITVVGFAEGALVGACALEGMDASAFAREADAKGGARAAVPVSGLVALCASGKTDAEIVQEALASAPEELKGEAAAIMAALKSGGSYPNPSPYFADFFRPSAQPYLASLYARDIRAAFSAAAARCSALVVAGGSDLQVSSDESALLAASAPGVAYRVVPGMSHALKGVGGDEEENYASFTDPKLPLAAGLVDLIASFAKGEEQPAAAEEQESGGASIDAADEASAPGADSQGAEDSGDSLAR